MPLSRPVIAPDQLVDELPACLERITNWPARRDVDESGLGLANARGAFVQCVAGLLAEHYAKAPSQFAPEQDARWDEWFVYQPIERHSTFFAERRARQAGDRRKRPYDQMAVAFPPAARLAVPLLVGRAVVAGHVAVRALEPTILVRKHPPPKQANDRQAHLHVGKRNCGATLNSLALVAHCEVAGAPRCLVLGTRPLTRHQDLQQSVPAALKSLLHDVDCAAYELPDSDAERSLAFAPVICSLLAGGAPRGRRDDNATDIELVAGRTAGLLRAVYVRDKSFASRWRRSRVAMLALPTSALPVAGPRRVAPDGLQATGAGWSPDPVRFAAEVADADVAPAAADQARRSPRAALPVPGSAAEVACQVPALLTRIGGSDPVAVVAHRPSVGGRATVWLTYKQADEQHLTAIEAHGRSRRPQHGTLTSPFDLWISRAFRRHAAADLLMKGGAGEQLAAGVSAASAAAFLLFALQPRR